MKVYIVLAGPDYEGFDIQAVFDSYDKAQKYVSDHNDYPSYNWQIQEYDVL